MTARTQSVDLVFHVPIDEYKSNMKAIVQYLVDRGLSKDKIVFMTPPTIDIEKLSQSNVDDFPDISEEVREAIRKLGPTVRSVQKTSEYAQACLDVGNEIHVDTLNLYQIFTQDSRGSDLLVDGIHFSVDGSKLLFDNLWPLVESRVLKHTGTEKLTQNFPDFLSVNRSDPGSSF
ncbi:Isoamyl acetate-hydrolyzing esterase 1 -like protein [Halotydeus destructor]|nr:Isoamyl acetate-hydrolyzing esterase 1 -like protein [Halotydeus destructor]